MANKLYSLGFQLLADIVGGLILLHAIGNRKFNLNQLVIVEGAIDLLEYRGRQPFVGDNDHRREPVADAA